MDQKVISSFSPYNKTGQLFPTTCPKQLAHIIPIVACQKQESPRVPEHHARNKKYLAKHFQMA